MVTTISKGFHDNGASATGKSYGPISIGAGFKLTRVEVRGALVFVTSNLTTSVDLQDPVTWGIQFGAFGYTPLAVSNTGTWDGGEWLELEQHVPGEITSTWAPSTSTAGAATGGPVSLTWIGQKKLAVATDLYFSQGQIYTSGLTWGIYGTMRAWYS